MTFNRKKYTKLSDAEKAENAERAKHKRALKSMRTMIKKSAEKQGLRCVELQLESLRATPGQPLPKSEDLSYAEVVACYEETIEEVRANLRLPRLPA